MSNKIVFNKYPFLKELGLEEKMGGCFDGEKWCGSGELFQSINPSTNEIVAEIKGASLQEYENSTQNMLKAKNLWMSLPMPRKGEIVRQIGDAFRKNKSQLGKLVSLEVGKILSEGEGEIQEIIDICDMCCGLSRNLNGQMIPSERPDHIMMEQWNPLGLIGVISAFNFPTAVFGWNFCVAAVCGNLTMWKSSPTTPLCGIACTKIIIDVLERNGIPKSVLTLCTGGRDIGEKLVEDTRFALISFTGSTQVGREVSQKVAKRFGKSILELGGNNCLIVCDDANEELALKASCFSAVGTCGQRCTSLRRLLIHSSKYESMKEKLVKAYSSVVIGDPLDSKTLCGPLHSTNQISIFERGLKDIQEQGGKILVGGKKVEGNGNFVQPTIVEMTNVHAPILQHELFVPILYIMKFDTLDEAIQINNSVPQGLSSSLFTQNVANVYKWTGPLGADTGIVNVNIGPSGAEIGGAFGGEKETGGGRESGSDSWKQYMRRSTCTINYGKTLPLAQGIKFDL
ncbi:hypothetical protein IMG5_134990 [Ichthyophthirius multifiliis]|uniref:Aldehyde dehydrogenase domain-containing protein n=1 Tax=Ichthyophthirius multifiliis TaxID=5932 RepID=G0QWT6_ICHMU|nr:hypothetical protein IMG5_134990 [Ichthyophthirius multifiliis]EGR30325.1 hypothetical protein IMG5_134990 [Ichthyophthirius multifiliis]|eukprot:XP_004031912.1 hypothetical protein IMG5_134990 [Ichthyophthirius multifiliis]